MGALAKLLENTILRENNGHWAGGDSRISIGDCAHIDSTQTLTFLWHYFLRLHFSLRSFSSGPPVQLMYTIEVWV